MCNQLIPSPVLSYLLKTEKQWGLIGSLEPKRIPKLFESTRKQFESQKKQTKLIFENDGDIIMLFKDKKHITRHLAVYSNIVGTKMVKTISVENERSL